MCLCEGIGGCSKQCGLVCALWQLLGCLVQCLCFVSLVTNTFKSSLTCTDLSNCSCCRALLAGALIQPTHETLALLHARLTCRKSWP